MNYEEKQKRILVNFLSKKIKEKNILKISAIKLPTSSSELSKSMEKLDVIRNDICNFFVKQQVSGLEVDSLKNAYSRLPEISPKGFLEKCSLLEEKLNPFLIELRINQEGSISLWQRIINFYCSLSIFKKMVYLCVSIISFISVSMITIFSSEINKLVKNSNYNIFK